VAVFLN